MQKKRLYFKEHPYCLYQSVENSPFPLPTNSLGLVGKKEYTKKKRKDTIRILVLGASPIERLPPASENKNKNPNLTLTHILEEKMNQHNHKIGANKTYEVLNLSSSGYTSYESLFSYICKGQYLEPDLVISYQGVNDVLWSVIADNYLEDYSHARKNNFKAKECWINSLFCALPDSKIIDFLDRLFVKFKVKKPNGLIYSISKNKLNIDLNYNPNKLNAFMNNLLSLESLSKLNSSKLINLSVAWDTTKPLSPYNLYSQLMQKKYQDIFYNYYNKYLIEINKRMSENNILETLVLPNEIFNSSCFYDCFHFNLDGMNKLADLICEYIITNEKRLF